MVAQRRLGDPHLRCRPAEVQFLGFSSEITWLLSAGWAILIFVAALPKCSSSATALKYESWRSSIKAVLPRTYHFAIETEKYPILGYLKIEFIGVAGEISTGTPHCHHWIALFIDD
ncbi:hypothetical protein [Rhizobium sp. Root1203]|uniref:hypothetical protein n=1 Tax=Rhizobium sp. Root1203 TaxID=1736427 RepID=UPI003FD53EC9